ncbi:MAG: hypothetical protein R2932_45245 [Caldilineaceae bacterium]
MELYLFGAQQVVLAGNSLTDLPAKTHALLFYLAVTSQSHPRSALATLLWGESAEKNARASLRKALQQLRQILPHHLILVNQSVALQNGKSVWVDAVHFADQLAQAATSGSVGPLAKAIALYRGDFLSKFFVSSAPDFERWQATQQAAAWADDGCTANAQSSLEYAE